MIIIINKGFRLNQLNKELLAEVLEIVEISKVSEIIAKYGYMEYIVEFDENRFKTGSVSIHELAHKYKLWALAQGHTCNVQMSLDSTLVYLGVTDTNFSANTEFEAVVKACEWIYEELKKDKK